jgi:hypothetical protein
LKDGWIPVSERLPTEAGQCITAIKPLLEDERIVKVQTYVPPPHSAFSGFRHMPVTHWMPLPEAPKC